MTDERSPSEPADEEELRSAAALARALEGGPAEPDMPREALETAAFLRSSGGAPQLSEDRRAQIRRQLLESLPPLSRPRRRRFGLPRWLVLGLPLAGAAALGFLVLPRSPELPASSMLDRVQPARVEQLDVPSERLVASSPADEAPSAEPAAREVLRAPSERTANLPFAQSVPAESARTALGKSAISSQATPRGEFAGGSPVALAVPAARSAANEAAGPTPVVAQAPAAESAVNDGAPRALGEVSKAAGDQHVELLARVNDATFATAHAELDAAHDRREIERSQLTLNRTLAALEHGLTPGDAHLARQDLYCRLAEAALRLGEPRTALEWTRRGLDLDGPPTPFLAQLHALEGAAWAALGDRTSAAGSYMKALRMHETLLDESLDGR